MNSKPVSEERRHSRVELKVTLKTEVVEVKAEGRYESDHTGQGVLLIMKSMVCGV